MVFRIRQPSPKVESLDSRALEPGRVGGLDLAHRHPQLERVDAHLGFDLEARGEHREALHEPPREHAVAREDVAEGAAEQARQEAGEDAVAEHVAAAIGGAGLVAAGADDHVELVGEKQVDHRRGGGGIVGQIAVGHDVHVGVDVGEHAADDMALALLALRADDRSGLAGHLASIVAAIVVVDVDRGAGQRGAEAGDRRADRGLLVVARQKDGDARRNRTVQAFPLEGPKL